MKSFVRSTRTCGAVVVVAVVGLVGVPTGPAAAGPTMSQLSVDEGHVDELVALVDTARDTFGGVSLDGGGGTLTVRYARSVGVAAARSLLAAVATPDGRAGRVSSRRVALVAVERSLRELDAVRDRVASDPGWLRLADPVISEWYVDVRRNAVAVGVTSVTPQVVAAARGLFGDRVHLHVAPRPERSATRLDDFEPWGAGIRISSGGMQCTSGFVIERMLFLPGQVIVQRQLVTAGHCFAAGAAVTNNGDQIGTVVSRNFVNGGLDVEYIGNSTYMPWTFKGPPTSDFGDHIRGGALTPVGGVFCTNGSFSGEVCSGEITANDICAKFTDGVTTCRLDRMTALGRNLTQPGDSGGNVFTYSGGQLFIGGIIIGGSNSWLASRAYFHAWHLILPAGGWTLAKAA